ncbi:uncharacterized protein LOC112588278 [Harpegnathos saltator]|uniref:uncharacterized protein LOC112588278 n=1 Tax=Harpegnathos saltator TaxID=610380 RepID=UPI000DBED1D2|nr:uncharacterized protein LOC112588278 [Harpegnathos saltator]
MQICMMVKKILNMDEGWDTRRLSKEEWIQSREDLMRLIKEELSRNLEFHEVAIIMFAKSCHICHQQANLQMCMSCYSINYCNDHAEEFQSVHSSNCHNQRLSFSLDITSINNFSRLLKFNLLFDTYESLIDMHSFVEKYLKTGPYKELNDTLFAYKYTYSEFASGPLTLYHGLRNTILFDSLDIYDSNYVIHVISVNYCDRELFSSWELFLHLLNHIQHLTIVMIEVLFGTRNFNIDVCSQCRERNRIITIECYSISYYSYVLSNSYKRPNVIIGFQANFNNKPTWPETILELREQNCPLFITFATMFKAQQCIGKLYTVLNIPLVPLYLGENKFHSLAPCRIVGRDNVVYRNKYLAIFKNLY